MAARAGMSLAAIAFPILAVAFVILAVVFKLDLAEPASPISRFFPRR
jgi:hypothetical protein